MTTILLPTGARITLDVMNVHDLGQYCMYQMDMLSKADDLMNCLGLEGWVTGKSLNPTINVNLKATAPAAFQEPCLPGNMMPTHYDGGTWQGVVTDKEGSKNYPPVEDMTLEQLRDAVKMQHQSLQCFMQATQSLKNLAENIKNATQPPNPPMVLAGPYTI